MNDNTNDNFEELQRRQKRLFEMNSLNNYNLFGDSNNEKSLEQKNKDLDKKLISLYRLHSSKFHKHKNIQNPDDLLNTGIDIVASPPGKKLTTISLLSGGEKTLTAISLLFAILNVRDIPFCLFDEVEAALDEANVEGFGNYLNHYKDKTQFLIITHKKKTMEFANTLYGITMQESGVSKLVSVKLEDANKVI